ncbi:MAG: hypothetical protein Kow0037_09480 [Calditrichia bacterium]
MKTIAAIFLDDFRTGDAFFWNSLSENFRKSGYKLLLFTSAPPVGVNFETRRIPFGLAGFEDAGSQNLPGSISEQQFAEWQARESIWLQRSAEQITMGKVAFAYHYFADLLKEGECALGLSWNRIFPLSDVFRTVCIDLGIPTLDLERGLVSGTMMIEPEGIAGLSRLANPQAFKTQIENIAKKGATPQFEIAALEYQRNHATKRNQPTFLTTEMLRAKYHIKKNERIIFFAGQADADAGLYPENTELAKRQSPYFKNSYDALANVEEAVQKIKNARLIFKPHPTDLQFEKRKNDFKHTIMVKDENLHSLIISSAAVINMASTVFMDALFLERPVVSLAPNQMSNRGVFYDYQPGKELDELIEKALNRVDFESKKRNFAVMTEFLLEDYLFNRTSVGVCRKNAEHLAETLVNYAKTEDFSHAILSYSKSGSKTISLKKIKHKVPEAKPLVSIIIPVFNKIELTRNCLEKIYQTVPEDLDFEIVIVDNASTDGTQLLLKKAQEFYQNLRVITNLENLGFARACNIGATNAKGKHLLFLNNDTEPGPGWIENLLRTAEEEEKVGVVGAKLLYPDGTIQHAGIQILPCESPFMHADYGYINFLPDHPFRNEPADLPEANRIKELDMVTAACMLIPAEVFKETNGFDEDYLNGMEDADLCLRIRSKGYKVVYQPASTLVHYEGRSVERYIHFYKNVLFFYKRFAAAFDENWNFQPAMFRRLQEGKELLPAERAEIEAQLKLLAKKEPKEKFQEVWQLINKYPNSEELRHLVSKLFYEKGDLDQAIYHAIIGYHFNPNNIDNGVHLATLYFENGSLEKAVQISRKILEGDPNNLPLLKITAKIAAYVGDQDAEAKILNRLKEIWKDDAEFEDFLRELHSEYSDSARIEVVNCLACGSSRAEKFREAADIVKCLDCGLIYLRTRPKQEDLVENYQGYVDEGSHMRLPKSQEEIEASHMQRHYFMNELLEFVEPKGKFLDVGCSWGPFLYNARKVGFEPRGIEVTRKAVEFANKVLGIKVTSEQFEKTKFKPESYTVVSMLHVLEHLPYTQKVLNHVFNILKPGGLFCGIVPNIDSFASELQGDSWEWLDPNFHYIHFSPKVLKRLLEEHGFIVERLYTKSGDFNPERLIKIIQETYKCGRADAEKMLKNLEERGHGEEIRFFARKPAEKLALKGEKAALALDATYWQKRKTPVVSIVIPVYNQVAYTQKCLETLYQNTNSEIPFEVIVVDDNSVDETPQFLKEAAKKYPKLKYFRNAKNLKFAGSCNRGAKEAQGKYLVFLNNDTEPQPGWLDAPLYRLENDPEIGALGVKLLYPDNTLQHCGIEFFKDVNPDYKYWPLHRYMGESPDLPEANRYEEVTAVTAACVFVPRKLFRKVDGFDEAYGMYFEDTDLCFKLRQKGYKIVYEPQSVVIHHEGKTTDDQQKVDEMNRRAAIRFYKKWNAEIMKIERQEFIDSEEGKFVYLKSDIFPREYQEGDVTKTAMKLAPFFQEIGPFYAHIGGAGDALMLLSSLDEKENSYTIVSVANSIPAMKSFWSAYPQIKKVYFIPFPENDVTHVLLRKLFSSLNNCMGMGVAPESDYYDDEWNDELDVFKKYKIKKNAPALKLVRKIKLQSFQVVIQPKGSTKGMVGSKKNIIDYPFWPKLIHKLNELGLQPVVIGTPDEEKTYPLMGECINKRSYNFPEQMGLVAGADLFIGADSWGKTLSALLNIPTIVFHSVRGEDLRDWKDASDFVFLDPWPEIAIVQNYLEFEKLLSAAMIAKGDNNWEVNWAKWKEFRQAYLDRQKKITKATYLIREGGLGDVLMTIPVARALKQKEANAKVYLVTQKWMEPLLMQSGHFDGVIDNKTFQLSFRGGKRIKDLNAARFGNSGKHQLDAYLQELGLEPEEHDRSINIKISPQQLAITKEKLSMALQKAGVEENKKTLVVLHPAKGDPNRTWPQEKWEELAARLVSQNAIPVIVGNTSNDPNRGVFNLAVPGTVNLVNQLSLIETLALFHLADVLVSTDSGPVQLAGATNIGLVVLYSVVKPEHRLPYRNGKCGWHAKGIVPACPSKGCYLKIGDPRFKNIIERKVVDEGLSAGQIYGSWCVEKPEFRCMKEDITVEMVLNAMDEVLREAEPGSPEFGSLFGLRRQAMEAYNSGQPEKAKAIWRKLADNFGDPESYVMLVQVEILNGDINSARKFIEEAKEAKIHHSKLVLMEGQLHLLEQKDNLAMKCFFELSQQYSSATPEILEAGRSLRAEGLLVEAADIVSIARNLGNKSPELTKLLIELKQQLGNQLEAEVLLKNYLQSNSTDPEALEWMGSLLLEKRELNTGIKFLERALANDSKDVGLLKKLADAYIEAEKYDEGIQLYTALISEFPTDFYGYERLASLYMASQDADSARELVRAYLQKNPDDAYAKGMLQALSDPRIYNAYQLKNSGNFKMALGLLKEVLDEAPGHVPAALAMAVLYSELGDADSCIKWAQRVLDIDPTNAEALWYLGKAFLALGQYPDFDNLLKLYSTLFVSEGNLSKLRIEYLISSQRYDEAMDEIDKYHDANPDDPEIYLLAGMLNYHIGEIRQSMRFFAKVLEMDPENQTAIQNIRFIQQTKN